MRKSLFESRFLMACLCFLVSGCASIVSGGLQTVPIDSTPSNAKLEITDNSTGKCIFSTNTPFSASLKRESGYFTRSSYKIRVTKDGYTPQEVTLEAGLNGWYFGNILFGGLIGMLIVDPATGAMWSLSDDPITIALAQEPPPLSAAADLPVKPVDPAPKKSVKPAKKYPEMIYE